MSAQRRLLAGVSLEPDEELTEETAGFYEFSLFRAVGRVRIVLLFLMLLVALASPDRLTSPLAVHTGLIIGVFLTLWTRYAARWRELHEDGHLDLAALVVTLGDITWLGLFALGTGGVDSPFVPLLIVPLIFTCTTLGTARVAVALATGVIVMLLVVFALGQPLTQALMWRLTGLAFALIAVAWVASGLYAVLERERRTSELVIRFMDEAVILADASGRIRLANPQVERFVGIAADDLVGLDLSYLPAEPRYQALRRVASPIFSPGAQPGGVRDVDVEVHERLELRVSTVRVAGPTRRPIAWLIICQDITDLKTIARAHASGVRFLSHEIRSPLTTLKTISAVFGELAAQLTDQGAGKLVEILDQEVDRMLRLARQFLDLAALEEGSSPLSLEPTDIAEVVAQVADSLRIRAEGKGLNFAVECIEPLPAVTADPNRLADVLHNLGDNAVKYTEPGGTVSIRASAVDGEIIIAVSDTGPGIPEEFRERVFHEFARGPQHEGPSTEGLGLGLFMARQIVAMHGGRIELDSQVGRGSTFSIHLPVVVDRLPPD
ncbi:MAG: sensor histidine kinase [Armatimonadota bacterium]